MSDTTLLFCSWRRLALRPHRMVGGTTADWQFSGRRTGPPPARARRLASRRPDFFSRRVLRMGMEARR